MTERVPRRRRRYRITNTTRDAVLAEASEKVDTPLRRGIGLIGRPGLPPGGGLIIQPCNSVVSFFMRFTIDVLFVNGEDKVAYALRNMAPWRVSRVVRGSKFVVELPAGTIDRTGTEAGDAIRIEPAQSM